MAWDCGGIRPHEFQWWLVRHRGFRRDAHQLGYLFSGQ
jgi:hypothetical protein